VSRPRLDVARRRSKPPAPGGPNRKFLQLGDDLVVSLLSVVGRQVHEDGSAAVASRTGGLKKELAKLTVRVFGGAVGVEELDRRGPTGCVQGGSRRWRNSVAIPGLIVAL